MSCCSSDAVQKLPIKQAGDVTGFCKFAQFRNIPQNFNFFKIIPEKAESCNLSQNIIQEIRSYQPIANGIMNAFISGPLKGKTFNDLADLTDQFGSRQVGTKNLEDAIDYMLNKLVKNGIENVHGEEVQVPHWVRGTEIATLISPTKKPRNIAIKGLGTSIGTPQGGITADVIVVDSFDELISRGREQVCI
jgi:carboxypeptidase Q